jgi:hypothetical protein
MQSKIDTLGGPHIDDTQMSNPLRHKTWLDGPQFVRTFLEYLGGAIPMIWSTSSDAGSRERIASPSVSLGPYVLVSNVVTVIA